MFLIWLGHANFFGGLIEEFGLDAKASDMVEAWVEGREETSRVDEVVAETLEKLKGKYVLGVLSNSTALNERVSVRKNCYGVLILGFFRVRLGIGSRRGRFMRFWLRG